MNPVGDGELAEMDLTGRAVDVVIGEVVTGWRHPSVELVTAFGRERVVIDLTENEAAALEHAVIDDEQPRPLPYQFIVALLAATDVGVRRVDFAQFADETLRADVVLTNGATVDARPGDALNVAALIGAPISVDRALFRGHSR